MATYEELMQSAEQIRTNELPESNTHQLVGQHLKNQIEFSKNENDGLKTLIDNNKKEVVEKISILKKEVDGKISLLGNNVFRTGSGGYISWQSGKTYKDGDVVIAPDGQLVECIGGTTSTSEYDPGEWAATTVDEQSRKRDTKISNIASSSGHVVCQTGGSTAAKTITVDGITEITDKLRLLVQMNFANTATGTVTLNINNLGAKTLYYNGATVSATNTWETGEIVELYYANDAFQCYNAKGGSGNGGNMILEWNTDVETTRKQVKLAYRKKLLQISYENGDGEITNEQYTGTLFDDTEWENDRNWIPLLTQDDIEQVKRDLTNKDIALEIKMTGSIGGEAVLSDSTQDIRIGYINTYGTIVNTSGYEYAILAIIQKKFILQVEDTSPGVNNPNKKYIFLKNKDDTAGIEGTVYDFVTGTQEVTPPLDANYIAIQTKFNGENYIKALIEGYDKIGDLSLLNTQNKSNLVGAINQQNNENNVKFERISSTLGVVYEVSDVGGYVSDPYGAFTPNPSIQKHRTAFFKLEEDTENIVFEYLYEQINAAPCIAFYENIDNLSETINSIDGKCYKYGNKKININVPSGANYVGVCYKFGDVGEKKFRILNATVVSELVEDALKEWTGKTWAGVGDSLTEKNYRSTAWYHTYISEDTGITFKNLGQSGRGYYAGGEENSFRKLLEGAGNFDVMTIFGSFNDYSASQVDRIPLGEITDTDTNTVCGCMNVTYDKINELFPTAVYGVVTPTPWGGKPQDKLNPYEEDRIAWGDEYVSKMIAICDRRGIPCLDLYHCSLLRPWDETYRTLMYSRDGGYGVHPDENGHKLIAPRFKDFLRKLLL